MQRITYAYMKSFTVAKLHTRMFEFSSCRIFILPYSARQAVCREIEGLGCLRSQDGGDPSNTCRQPLPFSNASKVTAASVAVRTAAADAATSLSEKLFLPTMDGGRDSDADGRVCVANGSFTSHLAAKHPLIPPIFYVAPSLSLRGIS